MPSRTAAERPMAVRIVGKHCESGDVIVSDARLPADVAIGDVLGHSGDGGVRLFDGLELQPAAASGGRLRPQRRRRGW